MDRDRWFKVVMGEKMELDVRSTEKIAQRIPLPESVTENLTPPGPRGYTHRGLLTLDYFGVNFGWQR